MNKSRPSGSADVGAFMGVVLVFFLLCALMAVGPCMCDSEPVRLSVTVSGSVISENVPPYATFGERVDKIGKFPVAEDSDFIITIDNGWVDSVSLVVDGIEIDIEEEDQSWGYLIWSEGAELGFEDITESHTVVLTIYEMVPT